MYIQNRVNFTLDDMLGEFNFSKRKAQMILKELRETSKKFGFNIETKRGERYSYNIIDEELHKSFLTQLETINSDIYDYYNLPTFEDGVLSIKITQGSDGDYNGGDYKVYYSKDYGDSWSLEK